MPDDRNRGAGRVVRPYTITGGRTASSGGELELEALVSADPAAVARADLRDERQAIALLCREMVSIAEISAHLAIPLGVARVLVGDMVGEGLVTLHRPGEAGRPPDPGLLERVLAGLRAM